MPIKRQSSDFRIEPGTGKVTAQSTSSGNIIIPPNQSIVDTSSPTLPKLESNNYLDRIRFNNLGGNSTEKGIYAGLETSDGYYTYALKSISAGDGLSIEETPNSIKLSITPQDATIVLVEGGQNESQTGGLVFKGIDSDNLMRFRNIVVGTGLSLNQTSSTITIGLSSQPNVGDITGGTNLGTTGAEIFAGKNGNNLEFKRIVSSNNMITVSSNVQNTNIVLALNESALTLANQSGSLPTSRISGLHAVANTGSYNDLNDKPTIPNVLNDLTNVSGTPTAGQVLTFNGTGWTPSSVTSIDYTQNLFNRITVGSTTIDANSPTTQLTLTGTNGIELSANNGSKSVNFRLGDTGVAPGSYTLSNITVDAQGRITAISNGSSGPGGFIDPMNSTGDIIYRASSGTTRLGIGSSGQVLTVEAGVPVWKSIPASTGSVTSVGISPGPGITVSNSPITSSGLINVGLTPTGTPFGTFQAATIQVDIYGRIISVSSNNIVAATRAINTGFGLQGGGDLNSDRTISLAPTGVSPGTYHNPSIQVDTTGRITSISSGGGLIDPTTVAGDLIVRGATSLEKLSVGLPGQVLTVQGGLPVWQNAPGAVSAPQGTYTNPMIQVNAQGRITNVMTNPDLDISGTLSVNGEVAVTPDGGLVVNALVPLIEIQSISSEINTEHKYLGKLIIDTTNIRMLISSGENPDDPWYLVSGTIAVTPA